MPNVIDAEVATRIRDTATASPTDEEFANRREQSLWKQFSDNRSRLPLDTLNISHPDDDHSTDVNAIVKAWQPSTLASLNPAEIRNRWVHHRSDESFGFSAELDELRESSQRLLEMVTEASGFFVKVSTRATNPTSTQVSFLRATHHGTGPSQSAGVLAINHQRQVLFTEDVEVDLNSLPRRKPRIVSYRRSAEDDE